MEYRGSCHCGAVGFHLRTAPITTAKECNCSICTKKGTIVSMEYFAPDAIELTGFEHLANYIWGDRMVNHYFCRTCGISPVHDVIGREGHYRVNLRCVAELDLDALAIEHVDGRSY